MADQFIINHIKFERGRGISDENIKKWFISAGLKPDQFEKEFEFLDAPKNLLPAADKEIKEILANHKPEKRITIWDKIIVRAKFILIIALIAICAIFIFSFSKGEANIPDRFLSFTNNIINTITQKNKHSSISNSGTSTIATSTVQTPEISTGTIAAVTTTTEVPIPATTTNGTSTPDETPIETETTEDQIDIISFASAISQARTLWLAKKGDESLAMAQRALQLAQTDREKAKAQYWIGLSYNLQGEKEKAEAAELLALNLDPGYEPPYVTLSAIKLDQKDCNQAFTYADKALQMNPNDPWALNNSGLSYLCFGDVDNAIIRLQKAASLAPDSYAIRHNLDVALQQINY